MGRTCTECRFWWRGSNLHRLLVFFRIVKGGYCILMERPSAKKGEESACTYFSEALCQGPTE